MKILAPCDSFADKGHRTVILRFFCILGLIGKLYFDVFGTLHGAYWALEQSYVADTRVLIPSYRFQM
jgi:hypothetical protein